MCALLLSPAVMQANNAGYTFLALLEQRLWAAGEMHSCSWELPEALHLHHTVRAPYLRAVLICVCLLCDVGEVASQCEAASHACVRLLRGCRTKTVYRDLNPTFDEFFELANLPTNTSVIFEVSGAGQKRVRLGGRARGGGGAIEGGRAIEVGNARWERDWGWLNTLFAAWEPTSFFLNTPASQSTQQSVGLL